MPKYVLRGSIFYSGQKLFLVQFNAKTSLELTIIHISEIKTGDFLL